MKILKKNQIIIGGMILISVISIFSIYNAKENKLKYINNTTQNSNVVAINISEDGTNYTKSDKVPTSGYALNKEKSVCRVSDGTTNLDNAPIDTNISIEYVGGKVNYLGISKNSTRCYLYFDEKKTTIKLYFESSAHTIDLKPQEINFLIV